MMSRRMVVRALALLVIVCAVGGAIWSQTGDRAANARRDVDVLDRLDPTDPLDAHTLWALGLVNGAPLDVADVEQRLSDAFLRELPATAFVESIDGFAIDAPYTFQGVIDRRDHDASVVRVADDSGRTYAFVSVLAVDGVHVDGLQFTVYDAPASSRDGLQITLLIAAVAMLALAAVRSADGARPADAAWWLTAAALWVSQFASASAVPIVYAGANVAPWAAIGIGGSLLVRRIAAQRPRATRPVAVEITIVATSAVVVATTAGLWIRAVETSDIGLPPNPFAVATDQPLASVLLDVRASALIVAAVVLIVRVGFLLSRTADLSVRIQSVVLIVAAATLAPMAIDWLWTGTTFDATPSAAASAALAIAGIGIAIEYVTERFELGEMAQLVVDLGDDTTGGSIEASLRRALDDVDLSVYIWSVERDCYVDARGVPVQSEPDANGRAVTRLDADGRRLGLVLHNPQRRPSRVRAACATVGLAIRNAHLEAEVRAQLAEVQASRTRLVEATDHTRRQIERDLHDGAQQRILSAMIELQVAHRRLPTDRDATERALDTAGNHLKVTLQDLRDLSRGLRPSALDRGLLPAIRDLADRSPIPIEVIGDGIRAEPALEHAAWFVVAEAVTNAWKHSAARRITVQVDTSEGQLRVEIRDDGRGGADDRTGGGLEGITDRVDALGGTVELTSPTGDGTRLAVEFPTRQRVDVEAPTEAL